MKNILLLTAIVLILFPSAVKAQTNVWFDDFESYTEGQNLATGAAGALYDIWVGTSNAWNVANHPGTTAPSGSQFANGVVGNALNWYMRKTLLLTAGKTYVFEAYTKSAINHSLVVKVGSLANVTTGNVTSPDWTKRSVSFTVPEGQSSTVVWIYQYNKTNPIQVDDFRVYEDIGTSLNSTLEVNDITITTIDNGVYELNSQNSIVNYKVFTIDGRMIQSMDNVNSKSVEVNLSNQSGTIFLLKATNGNGNTKTLKLFN